MTLTRENNLWIHTMTLPPSVAYAVETSAGLFCIHDDGRVMLGDVRVNDDASPALHNYGPDKLPYPVMHSGEAPPVCESNGYITSCWMGNGPVVPGAGFGTPIWMCVYHRDKGIVRYQMPYAGAILDGNPNSRRGIDNHCLPQVFVRESDKHVVYVEGCHNSPMRIGVSAQPHAAYGFHGLYPVGPVSRYTSNGHTYPAARLVGDTLHIVSRFLDGETRSLVYWSVETKTMQTGKSLLLDKAPADTTYCIWYQQPRVDGNKLVITTSRRYRPKDQPDTFLSEPEPNTFEVAI